MRKSLWFYHLSAQLSGSTRTNTDCRLFCLFWTDRRTCNFPHLSPLFVFAPLPQQAGATQSRWWLSAEPGRLATPWAGWRDPGLRWRRAGRSQRLLQRCSISPVRRPLRDQTSGRVSVRIDGLPLNETDMFAVRVCAPACDSLKSFRHAVVEPASLLFWTLRHLLSCIQIIVETGTIVEIQTQLKTVNYTAHPFDTVKCTLSKFSKSLFGLFSESILFSATV